MSAQEVERIIRSLPDAELRRFAQWWDDHRSTLLNRRAASESEAVKTELQHRRQEYQQYPERFERMDDTALDQMFRDIENEIP